MARDKLASAREYVLWLLARRDYPRVKLEQKLRDRDLSDAEIAQVLGALTEQGLFKAEAYGRVRARSLFRRGLGPRLVEARLRQERVENTAEAVHTAASELHLDPRDQARELLEKFLRKMERRRTPLDPRALKQKAIAALVSKGHAVGLAYELWEEKLRPRE